MTKRREFIKQTAIGTAGIAIGGIGFSPKSYASIIGANDRINLALIGIRNQGSVHISNWCSMKDSHNVLLKVLCDVDEQLFSSRTKMVSDKIGIKPATEWDLRKVIDFSQSANYVKGGPIIKYRGGSGYSYSFWQYNK